MPSIVLRRVLAKNYVLVACTVRRTLPNSAPTSACRQPDSSHKRKFAFKYVPFIQRKLVLSLERKISLSGKLEKALRRVRTLYNFSSAPLPTLPLILYIFLEFNYDEIKKTLLEGKVTMLSNNSKKKFYRLFVL